MKKDCTTCKYGYEDERLGIPMCHHPFRFSEDCVDFNMHEEKHQEMSKKEQTILEDAAKHYAYIDWSSDEDIFAFEIKKYDAFKAGAEWQKRQMLKDAVEREAEELYNDGESQCVVSVGTYFEPGDKVYVLKAEEG